MRVFRAWCTAAKRPFLPATAETVELYIADLIHRGRKINTLSRHLCGIQYAHRKGGFENPVTKEARSVLAGAKRVLCQPIVQKTALTVAQLRKIIGKLGTGTAIQARNAAILLYGFATALRRSNLAALRYEDLKISDHGITAFIRHEKQDRMGNGRTVSISPAADRKICPVRAVKCWIDWRGESPGPLFQRIPAGAPTGAALLGNRIAQIVQESVARIGLDGHAYGGHSLRSGFVTESILAGINDLEIMNHTGHRSLDMLRTYFRPVYALRENPCRRIGL